MVRCIYRKPGSDIKMFCDHIEYIFNSVHQNTMFICGGFNIDQLKCDSHNGSKVFIDLMHSFGLYPLIRRPSRITTTSATLIHNIFTNELENNVGSGLLLNDTTDHLPIFVTQ